MYVGKKQIQAITHTTSQPMLSHRASDVCMSSLKEQEDTNCISIFMGSILQALHMYLPQQYPLQVQYLLVISVLCLKYIWICTYVHSMAKFSGRRYIQCLVNKDFPSLRIHCAGNKETVTGICVLANQQLPSPGVCIAAS